MMTQVNYPRSMTCADGTGIEKGAVLKMTDPNTAATSDGDEDVFAGIAYTEKVANDGNTHISVLYGPGDEFKGIASGSIAIGDVLSTAAGNGFTNYLQAATAGLSGGHVVGIAKEAAGAGETFKYVLMPGASS